MHLPTSIRDRSFYAKFYSRPPSEIEIIDKTPSSTSYVLRTLSESPTTITPLSDVLSSGTSGFLSSSDCSSSESTSSYTKRRRTTAPIIQERLNTYESACARPSLPLPSLNISKQKTQSNSTLCSPSLVNQLIIPQQMLAEQTTKLSLINTTSNLIDNQISRSVINIQDDSLFHSNINEKSILFDSSKRYLSKSTSQLCDQSLNSTNKEEEEDEIFSTSRNILDVIQEELSEIRRADNDLKKMFISIYDKIQNIQQLKSTSTTIHPQHKGQRYHYHHNERPSRLIAHCCHSSNSDIRRMSCTHHHHNRKYSYHTAVALRNRMNNLRTSSTADNDSYVDTDSSSSSSDSGTCSSPVDNGPCSDD